jgi:hypothetical protein
MSRWASRITLEVTDVRVQRVQDISEEDALSEGVFKKIGATEIGDDIETVTGGVLIYADPSQARHEYRRLWDSIHGTGAWDRNDWVWAISFRRVGAGQMGGETA